MVSVVMAVYNGEKYLEEQMLSILKQNYPHIELIIVDDNSQDQSVQIIQKLASANSSIRLFINPCRIGLVPNFLKAASLAKGDLICFCDQDDYWRPDKVEILKKLLEEDKSNMLSYSDMEICDEKLNLIYPSFWKQAGICPVNGRLGEISFLKNIAPGCSMMFRKEVRDILVKIPATMPFMHDHLAVIVASGLGRLVYSKEKLVKYRQHPSNNIGAFYNSLINKERITRELKEKVTYCLNNPILKDLPFKWERLQGFYASLEKGGLFSRLGFLKYYLFLRNATFLDKALGFIECALPGLYYWLRRKTGPKDAFKVSLYAFYKSLLFIVWSMVVLSCFFHTFILYKLTKFLSTR